MSLIPCAPRALYTKLIMLGSFLTFILFLYTMPSSDFSLRSFSFSKSSDTTTTSTGSGSCSPSAYSAGKWSYSPRTNKSSLSDPSKDSLEFAGFQGCASSREFLWHLAADQEAQYNRFPAVSSWKWDLSSTSCSSSDFRSLDAEKHKEEFIRELVERGGWLILGDSITEGHFFSISCSLYPHVVALPDYVANPYFDRAWPQNMYLNPNSPLIPTLTFPPGFNITQTPLITFRRIDLLLSTEELVELHREKHLKGEDQGQGFELFSDEKVWTLSPTEYLPEIFLAPLPKANYANLIVSTAGHWTTTLFSGYANEPTKEGIERHGEGLDGLIDFFGQAMEVWADQVQEAINKDRQGVVLADGKGRARRQVLVRAYLTGHEDCHDHRKPWTKVKPMKWNWYNWGSIWKYNDIFEKVVSKMQYPDIHYLAIERPARLRPDAHATGDCLHIMAGAGVLEGWTEYLWHFISKENPNLKAEKGMRVYSGTRFQ